MPESTVHAPSSRTRVDVPPPIPWGSRWILPLASVGMVGLIVLLDAWTEPNLSLKLFYLLPVLLASWTGGAATGILVAFAGAVAWYVADPSNREMSVALAIWNTLTRFVLFGTIAALFARIRRSVLLEREGARQVRDFNRILEERVKERTGDLEASLADLKGFAYAIAHELRAPLRAMHGFSEILLRESGPALGAEEKALLAKIAGSAGLMDRQILALLEYAGLLHGRFEPGPVDLAPFVASIVAELEPELRARGAEVRLDGPFPVVQAHHEPLTRALRHLLLNAARFVPPERPPRIRVRTEARGDAVRLWVEDNGIGIPAAYQEGLFLPFHRLEPRSDPEGGAGMGLAIVRKALERMGGRAGVESEPGRGSRFWIELPR